MKKIGIITPYGNSNHGNKLQNLALKMAIEKLGKYEVYTIKKEPQLSILSKIKYNILNSKKAFRSYRISKINSNLNYIDYDNSSPDFFDSIVVGSDQIWNYTFAEYDNDFCFGKKYNCRKISYAASIGTNEIKEKYKLDFINNLKDYSAISVREKNAQLLLTELGLNDVKNVIDPTLLISKVEWNSFISKPKKFEDKKYIFTYFLGKLDDNFKNKMKTYARKNNLKIIDILDPNDNFYSININEFLYLIKNSEMVCCDSFHACVFSIIFNKPFIFYDKSSKDRVSMSSRTDTLFSLFDLNDRQYLNQEFDEFKMIDYNKVNLKLTEIRKKSIDFLQNSLEKK